MSITEAARPWMEQSYPFPGLTMHPLDHSTDNGVLFLATLVALTPAEERAEWNIPAVRVLEACAVRPGLLARYPGDQSKNSVDNLWGALVLTSLVPALIGYRDDIISYGRAHNLSWSVEQPGEFVLSDWYGRFPGFGAMLDMLDGIPLDFVSQLVVAGSIIYSALTPRADTSNKCLQYLLNPILLGKHIVVDLAIQVWAVIMNAKYSRGLRDLYAIYFGEDHLFTQFAPSTPFRF